MVYRPLSCMQMPSGECNDWRAGFPPDAADSLLPHWYACQPALGIRARGLYCTKDTFVTTAQTDSMIAKGIGLDRYCDRSQRERARDPDDGCGPRAPGL